MVSQQRTTDAATMTTPDRGVSPQGGTAEPGVTKLVGGIIEDIQELFKAQLELFQAEIQDDLRQTKEASVLLAAGGLVLLLGGIFLGLMLVHLLNEQFAISMWGSFAIVGGGFAVLGIVLFFLGQRKFASFNPLPDKSVAALKEAFNGRVRSHQNADGSSA